MIKKKGRKLQLSTCNLITRIFFFLHHLGAFSFHAIFDPKGLNLALNEAFAHIHHEQTETTTFDLGAIVDMCESRLLEHDLYVCNHGQASCKTTYDGRGHCNNKSFKPRRSLI